MTSEEKLRIIIAYLKNEIQYKNEFDSYLAEIYTYMKYNMTSPLTIEFFNEYFKIKDGIYKQIDDLNTKLKNGILKNEEFKNAFKISHIPFKCDEQYFLYKMIKVLNNDYSFESTFDAILPKINKYLFNDSFDSKELLNMMGEHAEYNVVLNQNFYEKNKKKRLLMRQYQEGSLIITDPYNLTNEQLGPVGYRGELHFKQNYQKNDDKILLWISQDVNGFAHIDFLEYDYKKDHLSPHEVKTTVRDINLDEATLTSDEFLYMCDNLESKNVTYNLHRYAFTTDLNDYKDGTRFVIANKGSIKGYRDNGNELNIMRLFTNVNGNNETFYLRISEEINSEYIDTVKKKILKIE